MEMKRKIKKKQDWWWKKYGDWTFRPIFENVPGDGADSITGIAQQLKEMVQELFSTQSDATNFPQLTKQPLLLPVEAFSADCLQKEGEW